MIIFVSPLTMADLRAAARRLTTMPFHYIKSFGYLLEDGVPGRGYLFRHKFGLFRIASPAGIGPEETAN